MCHICGFICYLCVELKLMIKTRSLSNQAMKSAHPSLLSSRCWPWVFIGAGQPLQHGEVRDTNLAWVRPVGPTSTRARAVGIRKLYRRSRELLFFCTQQDKSLFSDRKTVCCCEPRGLPSELLKHGNSLLKSPWNDILCCDCNGINPLPFWALIGSSKYR